MNEQIQVFRQDIFKFFNVVEIGLMAGLFSGSQTYQMRLSAQVFWSKKIDAIRRKLVILIEQVLSQSYRLLWSAAVVRQLITWQSGFGQKQAVGNPFGILSPQNPHRYPLQPCELGDCPVPRLGDA